MGCVVKTALQNEINIYKQDNDIKSLLQYLHYFNLTKSSDEEGCKCLMNSVISLEQAFDLISYTDNFSWLINKIIEKKNIYFNSARTESDFKKYSFFINSIDLSNISYPEMSILFSEVTKGLENYTFADLTE